MNSGETIRRQKLDETIRRENFLRGRTEKNHFPVFISTSLISMNTILFSDNCPSSIDRR